MSFNVKQKIDFMIACQMSAELARNKVNSIQGQLLDVHRKRQALEQELSRAIDVAAEAAARLKRTEKSFDVIEIADDEDASYKKNGNKPLLDSAVVGMGVTDEGVAALSSVGVATARPKSPFAEAFLASPPSITRHAGDPNIDVVGMGDTDEEVAALSSVRVATGRRGSPFASPFVEALLASSDPDINGAALTAAGASYVQRHD